MMAMGATVKVRCQMTKKDKVTENLRNKPKLNIMSLRYFFIKVSSCREQC